MTKHKLRRKKHKTSNGKRFDVKPSSLLEAYIYDLISLERYGKDRPAVVYSLLWKEIRKLIELGLLQQRPDDQAVPAASKKIQQGASTHV